MENLCDYRPLMGNGRGKMVGVERFSTNRKYEQILDHRLVGITTIVVIHAQTV